jgi:hypothetical protein
MDLGMEKNHVMLVKKAKICIEANTITDEVPVRCLEL